MQVLDSVQVAMPITFRQASLRLIVRYRLLLACMGALVLGLGCWGWVPGSFTEPGCRLLANGAWLSVDWTAHPADADTVAALAQHAADYRLRYLFPFTTSIWADGSFSPLATYARPFVAAFHQTNHTTLLLAWIGLPHDVVDLTDPPTRSRIVRTITTIIGGTGFDGVHIDAEPIMSGDPAYLIFLDELRAALPVSSFISVAGLPWMSDLEAAVTDGSGYRWSSAYYQAIATRVDQLVTMTYDSHAPIAALYRLWMREQVRGIAHSVAGSNVVLMIGVSLAQEATNSHYPAAETLPAGLAGLCAAISRDAQSQRAISGVALYAPWDATDETWGVWQDWQGIEQRSQSGDQEQPQLRW